ncbi:hypothetical protein [Flavobacterium sp. J27]|uniref:hypothetical protein n=1 Tax=Flavobacterium sp. J27 TaxID=2060419 RepID=UPI0010311E2F|nr:hypothetical protein [Flavobacterium sp. J27]
MKKLLAPCIVLFLFVISCQEKSEKQNISAFEIKGENDVVFMEIKEDGTIYSNNNLIGKFENQNILKDKNDHIILTLKEGFLYDDKENKLVAMDENGKIENSSGNTLRWDENGELLNNEKKSGFKISPVKQQLFQPASILLYSYLHIHLNNP